MKSQPTAVAAKPQKKRKKPERKFVYDRNKMKWFCAKTKKPKDPPKPKWAMRSSGTIPHTKFIKAWVDTHKRGGELEDLHKKFFWKTEEELRQQHRQVNRWIKGKGFLPLPDMESRAKRGKRSDKQFQYLLKNKYLVKAETT